MDKKLQSMFSLSKRAGKLLSGEVQVSNALSGKNASLIIVATDVSDNTKDSFRSKCNFYNVDFLEYGTRDEISALIGSHNKTVFCVTDVNFANNIKKLILDDIKED